MKTLYTSIFLGLTFAANAQLQRETMTINTDQSVLKQQLSAAKLDIINLNGYHSDEKPQFQKWQEHSTLERIEYTVDRTIFHYKFTGGEYDAVVLYEPKTGAYPWYLRSKNVEGKTVEMLEIRNVKVNGEVQQALLEETSYYYSVQTLTCEVHFPRIPEDIKVADLMEGRGTDEWTNHFHCLNIQLQQPKKPEPVAENPMIQIPTICLAKLEKPTPVSPIEVPEPVALTPDNNEESNTSVAKVEPVAQVKVYPVPNNGTFYIEHSRQAGKYTIQLLDLQGRIVQQQISHLESQQPFQFNAHDNIIAGSYLVRIVQNGFQETVQITIVK